MPEYQNRTDSEVLQIATEREQLTDDARMLLDSELTRRKLSIKDVRSQRMAYERADKLEQTLRQRRILSPGSFDRCGTGVTSWGNRTCIAIPWGNTSNTTPLSGWSYLDSYFPDRNLHGAPKSVAVDGNHN